MPSPLPSVPTPLVDVQITTAPRRGVPLVVVARPAAGGDGAGPELGPLADRLGLDARWLELVGATGRAGQAHAVPAPDGSQGWLVGLGSGESRDWRAAGAALARAVDGQAANEHREGRRPARAVQVALPEDVDGDAVAAFTLGAMLGGHAFRVTNERTPRTKELRLVLPAGVDETAMTAAVREGRALAAATGLARDLASTPSDVKDPAWLADTAARLAEAAPGLTAVVRDEAWLRENGFGGVLAVGGGSARPPRLLELSHQPRGAAKAPHLVLVGKGITFDTGGISIKPADGMHLMRTDMSGGAAVIAALLAIAELNLPVRVTGLVPCAENHVSGSAYRPGDVVRHYGGTTTEVTNTDAEGRMVMADALAYAVHRLKPDLLVDVATLTGAMKVALGLRTGGLFATEDELAERITEAGRRAGEAWWRMPLLDDHAADVRSDLADVRQCPPGPGGITAALFLREFTGGLPWAHLDIAGPARSDKVYDEVNPGGTGFAARTLVEFARSYC
ncbi:leucyl aminopeptidase [Streptoalloteichus hindustanus]|uniref:Probable cytosol aminopeptidase n=1 Tax=Streptoalloteichus hindustanus TaxID=2017 RepID=A0A1M5J368_STRHI|nr:leucyl aminopeptidase [Streptoalloteichus hindustanus]SHG34630.1 leucyl aminopeptidase [Streptoalloteichus hindustanus]